MARYTEATIIPLIEEGKVDIENLSKTLYDLRNFSYSYLQKIQKNLIGIHKIHIQFNDLKIKIEDNTEFFTFTSDFSFIHHTKRKSFRNHKYFNKKIFNSDIGDDETFVYKFFVFINGQIDISAKIKCKEDLSIIYLNSKKMESQIKNSFNSECNIDILFIKNSSIKNVKAVKNDIVTSQYKFIPDKEIDFSYSIFAFISKESGLTKMYECSIEQNNVILPEESLEDEPDSKEIKISFLFIPNFLEQKKIDNNTIYFSHSATRMPIPVENIITFKRNEDKSILIDNSFIVNKNYYEIFSISNKKFNEVINNIYYCKEFETPIYISEIEFYSKLNNLLDLYIERSIIEEISLFKPIEYEFDILEEINKITKKEGT